MAGASSLGSEVAAGGRHFVNLSGVDSAARSSARGVCVFPSAGEGAETGEDPRTGRVVRSEDRSE